MEATAAAAPPVPRVSWSDFLGDFRWEQGEHVTLIGRTRSGKTTLVRELLRLQRWNVVLVTKGMDRVLDRYQREDGYHRVPAWVVADPDVTPRVLLAPKLHSADRKDEQAQVFREALSAIHRQGGWTVYIDEALYLEKYLGVTDEPELLMYQGASSGVSVVTATQRPRWIAQVHFDQATHLFFWQNRDRAHLKRLEEIGGGVDSRTVQQVVPLLESHEVLYLNTWTGQMLRTEVEA